MNPEQLRFSKTHEWVYVDEQSDPKIATLGLSAFAIEALTDLVFIELPEVGTAVTAGSAFGEVESVKAVSDLYSPVTGEVCEANTALPDNFDLLGNDPYGAGWIIKIKIADDGRVTVQVPRQEMGQGVTTSLPMLVAEELDADFGQVGFEQAPVDPVYGNATVLGDGVPFRRDDSGWLPSLTRLTQFKVGEALGVMATGGSSSVRDAWEPMRRAGATARAMLVQAAADRFGAVTTSLATMES